MRASGASGRAARYRGISGVVPGRLDGHQRGVRRHRRSCRGGGVHRRALEGITAGYGFSGIVVALFGGLSPIGIIPASFFFGLLIVGADMTQRLVGVPANMINVLQGIIILVIVATKMILADPYLAERVWRAWQKRGKKHVEMEA